MANNISIKAVQVSADASRRIQNIQNDKERSNFLSAYERPFISKSKKTGADVTVTDYDPTVVHYSFHNALSDDENTIRISDTEKYSAYELMLPEHLQKKPYVFQSVPVEIADKIEKLFRYNKQKPLYRQLVMINMYFYGFTVYEIADFYNIKPQNVSTDLKKGRQLILDNLTEEEISKCYWYIGVPKPRVTVTQPSYPYAEVLPPIKKQKVNNPWKELGELLKAPTRQN